MTLDPRSSRPADSRRVACRNAHAGRPSALAVALILAVSVFPALAGEPPVVGQGSEAPLGEAESANEPDGAGVRPVIEEFELELSGSRLHFLHAKPAADLAVTGPPVLLLHGGRFSSETWRELGTLELLARQGYEVWALDLPGYGRSPASTMSDVELLSSLVPLISDRPVVVLSPSMSGRFSLPFVADRPSWVAGWVAVAPVAIDRYLDELEGSPVPTLILWGSQDEVIPLDHAKRLSRALPASRRVVFEGASHPCYLDQPIAFHRELLQFLAGL